MCAAEYSFLPSAWLADALVWPKGNSFRRPHRLVVRTPPFHGGNTGSIPVGDAKKKSGRSPGSGRFI